VEGTIERNPVKKVIVEIHETGVGTYELQN